MPDNKERIVELMKSIEAQVNELYSLVAPTENEIEEMYEGDYGIDDLADTLNEAIIVLDMRDTNEQRNAEDRA